VIGAGAAFARGLAIITVASSCCREKKVSTHEFNQSNAGCVVGRQASSGLGKYRKARNERVVCRAL
jgi:hypothetical protein